MLIGKRWCLIFKIELVNKLNIIIFQKIILFIVSVITRKVSK